VVANKKSRFSVLTIVCHPFFAGKRHQLIQRSRTLWSSVSSYHINIGDGEDKKPLGSWNKSPDEGWEVRIVQLKELLKKPSFSPERRKATSERLAAARKTRQKPASGAVFLMQTAI
jgi:hypothetical protein